MEKDLSQFMIYRLCSMNHHYGIEANASIIYWHLTLSTIMLTSVLMLTLQIAVLHVLLPLNALPQSTRVVIAQITIQTNTNSIQMEINPLIGRTLILIKSKALQYVDQLQKGSKKLACSKIKARRVCRMIYWESKQDSMHLFRTPPIQTKLL